MTRGSRAVCPATEVPMEIIKDLKVCQTCHDYSRQTKKCSITKKHTARKNTCDKHNN
jgi:hypothetical protein